MVKPREPSPPWIGPTTDVFRKGPGDAAYLLVADDTTDKIYNTSGLAAGNHDFKVVARNSKGAGPANDVSVVAVG